MNATTQSTPRSRPHKAQTNPELLHWFKFLDREIGVELKMLQPDAAKDLLDNKNSGNRPITDDNVARMARDMQEGRWRFTGEPIIIAEDGNMHDGQHRCKAVIDSSEAIPVIMVYNIPCDAMVAIDQGKGRSVRDILITAGMAPTQNDAIVRGAARLLMSGDRELSKYVDNRQRIAEYVQEHRAQLVEYAAWAKSVYQDAPPMEVRLHAGVEVRKSMSPSIIAALAMIMEARGGGQKEVRMFFEKIVGQVRADNDIEHSSITAVKHSLTHSYPLRNDGNRFGELMNVFMIVMNCYNKIQLGVQIKKVAPRIPDEPPRWFDELPRVGTL
jgi:hypothetical protein